MATIPTPRSYNRVLGDMIDVFLSKFGLKQLRVGSPVLSILEAAAMSDLRSSQDIFDLLSSSNLDRATSVALDRIGADEDLTRRSESAASGLVAVTDSRISKVSTRVYQGKPAPIATSSVLYVVDASGTKWPSTGKVYIGRGTANLEGPLEYISKTDNGSYWTLTLKPGNYTTRFHNIGETVTLAQNGNRVVAAGTIVQTPQGNSSNAVQFSTLYPATIPDGEVTVEGITVVARANGVIGNVPAGSINGFQAFPFPGATVTNPLPFSNGQSSEGDTDFRERIKATRQSRTKGTALAIQTAVTGITSSDENKRVTSASMVARRGLPSTLYVDDGTGYEEQTDGIAIEPLNDSSLGGEEFFQLSQRPVTKAFVESTGVAPFALADGAQLSVDVGGVLHVHTFGLTGFRNIENASAYEVIASINANPDIAFSARTSAGGTKVVLFAKVDENEDIEVLDSSANDVLLFPTGRAYTLRLYKNDVLLTKDGVGATLRTQAFSEWDVLSSGETLTIAVDGTPAQTFTFTSADFVDSGSGYSTLGNNSLAAWVKVLNYRIPGITAVENAGAIDITSNAGRSSRAKLAITGGTFVTKDVFNDGVSQGADSDYTLDRFTGQVRLSKPLVAGDRLAAGSTNTRAFSESGDITPVTLSSSGKLFVAVDGRAEALNTGITASDLFDITTPNSGAWGKRIRVTQSPAGTIWKNAAAGDWLIIWDSGSQWANLQGMWRVVDAGDSWVEFEVPSTVSPNTTGANFDDVGVALVRYDGQLQQVTVPSGAFYTASTFVSALNSGLEGAQASTYRTSRIRLRTNSFAESGDTAVVSANLQGQKLLLPVGSAVVNRDSHLGSVETANRSNGTPDFNFLKVDSSATTNSFAFVGSSDPDRIVSGLKNTLIVAGKDRFGNNRNVRSAIQSVVGSGTQTLNLRVTAPQTWQVEDRFYLASPYMLGSSDDVTVVVDGDETTKRYPVALWRALRPVGVTYSSTVKLRDIGDGTQTAATLATAFGTGFDFNDFALYMRARAKSHEGDLTKAVLWRNKRFGPEGNNARVRYKYPAAANTALAVTVDPMPTTAPSMTNVSVSLPSDPQKTLPEVRNTTTIGYGYWKDTSALGRVTVALGFPVASATRTGGNSVTLTLTLPSALYAVTSHGVPNGSTIWVQSTSSDFPTGLKTITAVGTDTVTYTESGSNVTVSSIGTISRDTVGEATFSNATPSSLVAGDIIHFADYSSFPSHLRGTSIRISNIGPQFIQGYAEADTGVDSQSLAWTALADTTKLTAYPLKAASCTALAIKNAVNAFSTACPVTATLVGSGGSQVLLSTRDELNVADAWYVLKDGINWVKTTLYPATSADDYEFELKGSTEASLAASSDWANEELRIVPITLKGLVDWLQVLSISGLSSAASVTASSQASRLQLASVTPGSSGSIQVQGGTANAAAAPIVGSASASGTYCLASVKLADIGGFIGRGWVVLENTSTLPKSGVITSTTNLASVSAGGKFTIQSGTGVLFTSLYSTTNAAVQVEKHGDYVAIVGVGHSSVSEGDWVHIQAPSAGTAISAANQGIFRVVRSTSTGFWIENSDAQVESLVDCNVAFYTADSMMPGDVISIGTDLWGVGNKGQWVVQQVGDTLPFDNAYVFTVALDDDETTEVVTGPVGALGATEAKKVIVSEREVSRLVKRIHAITPNQADTSLVDVKFDSEKRSGVITSSAGTTMAALDKLAFPTSLSKGIDGYDHSTGLIGEATRVVYGDERDPATYPGVIAAGAAVNISGPLVKRISVSLAIRARLGVSTSDVAGKVRSAVASVVNKSGVGQSIAISDLVNAAARVNGVQAVTIVSPTYGVGSDLIAVQPYEKALVLNVDTDVLVTFVGE